MFKKDKFCKFVILSLLIFVTPITFSNDNKTLEIERLKQEIVNEKQGLQDFMSKTKVNVLDSTNLTKLNGSIDQNTVDEVVNTKEYQEYLENYTNHLEKIADLDFKLAELEWRVYNFNEEIIENDDETLTLSKINWLSWTATSAWNNLWFIDGLKPWDIISLKHKYVVDGDDKFWPGFRTILKNWTHTVLYVWNWMIIWAEWPGKKSMVMNARKYFDEKRKKVQQIVVARKNISDYTRRKIRDYAFSNLVGKNYPPLQAIPVAKYDTFFYYCSSLAWRALYNFWYDLDPNSWSKPYDIIFPIEFISTSDRNYYINL